MSIEAYLPIKIYMKQYEDLFSSFTILHSIYFISCNANLNCIKPYK